jgi:hypothetical protein
MDDQSTKTGGLVSEDINYNNLLNMLNSSDRENAVVALTCIENIDFKLFMLKIMLLYKESKVELGMWKEHAPKAHAKLMKAIYSTKHAQTQPHDYVTFDEIVRACAKETISEEDTQLLVSVICKKMQDSFEAYGLSCIESLDVKINFKPND